MPLGLNQYCPTIAMTQSGIGLWMDSALRGPLSVTEQNSDLGWWGRGMSLLSWAPRYIKNGCHFSVKLCWAPRYIKQSNWHQFLQISKLLSSKFDANHGLCFDNLQDDIAKNFWCKCCGTEQYKYIYTHMYWNNYCLNWKAGSIFNSTFSQAMDSTQYKGLLSKYITERNCRWQCCKTEQ